MNPAGLFPWPLSANEVVSTVHTNEVVSTNALVKFADDMALVARLQAENSLAQYFFQLDFLNLWLKESLDISTTTKEELAFESKKQKQ